MDTKQRDELLDVFREAFHEVVPPLLDELKKEIAEVLENGERVERKLDNITDSHAAKLDNHEHRIGNLEKKASTLS